MLCWRYNQDCRVRNYLLLLVQKLLVSKEHTSFFLTLSLSTFVSGEGASAPPGYSSVRRVEIVPVVISGHFHKMSSISESIHFHQFSKSWKKAFITYQWCNLGINEKGGSLNSFVSFVIVNVNKLGISALWIENTTVEDIGGAMPVKITDWRGFVNRDWIVYVLVNSIRAEAEFPYVYRPIFHFVSITEIHTSLFYHTDGLWYYH